MKKISWLIGSALLLMGAGCSSASPDQASLELTYTLPDDGSVTVIKNSVAAGLLVDADLLFTQATECGFARTVEYYLDIENLFKEKMADQYTFTTTGDYADPSSWIVTVMPNSPLYSSTDSFRQDFNVCAVGGDLYPVTAGTKALLFSNSCGSGYQENDETRESGCDVVREVIEPTLFVE